MNWVIFAVLLSVFTVAGLSGSRPTSVTSLVRGGSLRANAISLIATDITLGTGFVYLFSGAQQNGWPFLAVPVATAVGYFLQGWYVDRVLPLRVRTGPNLLWSLDEAIARVRGQPSLFALAVSACLVSTFVLVLAFEIFASSSVISPLLVQNPDSATQASVSLVVFAVTVVYALIGGIRATHRVDVIQVPLVTLGILCLTVIAMRLPVSESQTTLGASATGIALWVNMAAATLAAIATQFYSIINWNTVASVETKEQRVLFTSVGVGSGVMLTAFVVLGLFAAERSTDFAQLMGQVGSFAHSSDLLHRVLGIGVLCGFGAILFTTTDALVIAAVHFVTQNILSPARAMSPQRELRRAQFIGAAVFATSFLVLMILNYLKPDPFYLLLSMVAGIGAFAPLIALAGVLSRDPHRLGVLSNKVLVGFVGLFFAVGLANITALRLAPRLSSLLGLVAISVSALACTLLWVRSGRQSEQRSLP